MMPFSIFIDSEAGEICNMFGGVRLFVCLSVCPSSPVWHTLHRKKVTFNLFISPGAPGSLTMTYSLDDLGSLTGTLGHQEKSMKKG